MFDKATGLNYMQARYYDPLIARFLSIDPVGFEETGRPGMFNRYAYTLNDPVNWIDPTGRMVEGYFSRGNGMALLRDMDTGKYAVSSNWFSGKPGVNASEYSGPVPAGTYSILSRGLGSNGYRWYRLEAQDGSFGDDDNGGRTAIRLHPGTISLGCVTCRLRKDGTSPEYDDFDKLLQNTASSTSKVKRGGTLGKLGASESLTNYGTLGVLPDGLSLNFNSNTNEFRIQGNLGTRFKSRIKINIDKHVCTVDADSGTCK